MKYATTVFILFKWSSNHFLVLNIFYFLFRQTSLFITLISLCFDLWIFCHLLANLFPISGCFFCFFGCCVTVHKPCHVQHVSQITTSGTIFSEIFFGTFKEWVRSWPHAFLITNLKMLAKTLLVIRPEKQTSRKKRKTKLVIVKLFALHANAKTNSS